jgi:hypothetical protein
MKLTRSPASRLLPLCLSASLALLACGTDPAPFSPAAAIDNAIRTPTAPGEPVSLARVTRDDGYQIERMRLAGDYLFFATHVLYRMPKYGGELTVVDSKVDDRGLAANGTHVFWEHDRDDTLGGIEVGQYAISGAPEGAFPIDPATSPISSFEGNDFLATDEALYVFGVRPGADFGEVVTRYPLDGTPPSVILEGGLLGNWIVDGDRIYFTRAAEDCDSSSCGLESAPLAGGPPTVIAALPGPEYAVVGGDAEAVYLASATKIVRAAKADGGLTTIFAAPAGTRLSGRMVLDAQRLYFVTFGSDVPRVMAVAKTGESPAVEIGHSAGLGEIFHATPQEGLGIILGFEQDEHNLFILPASSEIFMFAKDPS